MATLIKSVRKHIFLHPAERQNMQNSIRSVLLKDKKKHSDKLGGALLDVNGLKVIGDRHVVVDGYLSMEVVADMDVFAPTTGMQLKGVINKRSKSHVGCLVLDMFNAVLTVPRGSSLDPHLGDTCLFAVTEVVVDDSFLFLKGRLLSILETSDEIGASQIEHESKGEDNFFEREMQRDQANKKPLDSSTIDALDSTMFAPESTPKKRKRKKMDSVSEEQPTENSFSTKSEVKSETLSDEAMDSTLSRPTAPSPSKKEKKRREKDQELEEQPAESSFLSRVKSEVICESFDSSLSNASPSKKGKKKKRKDSEELPTEDSFSSRVKSEVTSEPSGNSAADASMLNTDTTTPKRKKKRKDSEELPPQERVSHRDVKNEEVTSEHFERSTMGSGSFDSFMVNDDTPASKKKKKKKRKDSD